MYKKLLAIDFFSGAGGFHRGFEKEGFEIILAIDNDPSVRKTHEKNFPHIPLLNKDIKDISFKEIENIIGNKKIDVFIGGPPCQGFSTMGKRYPGDPRNSLFYEYFRFIKYFKPRFVVMENVRGLLGMQKGNVVKEIEKELKDVGYKNFDYRVINAADYGVPQIRYRVFIIANNINHPIRFPLPDHFKKPKPNQKPYKTVGEVINDLIESNTKIPNHIAMNHNSIVRERMKYIPEGGKLRTDKLPVNLKYGCRKDFKNRKIKNFSHVYKRLDRNKPSTTMVPGHNAFPVHPILDRTLTPREAARIQTFPDSIIFEGTRQEQCIQVGNAVPPLLAQKIARVVKLSLDAHDQKKTLKDDIHYFLKDE